MYGQMDSPISGFAIHVKSDTHLQENQSVRTIIAMVFSGLRVDPFEMTFILMSIFTK